MSFEDYKLPPIETNYVCTSYKFPTDQAYHIVKLEMLVDNAKFLHHMVLYSSPNISGIKYANCTEMPPNAIPMWAWVCIIVCYFYFFCYCYCVIIIIFVIIIIIIIIVVIIIILMIIIFIIVVSLLLLL